MTDRKKSTLPEAFENAVEIALNEASIYDIGSYGWVNENDEDTDLIGHAMWQTNQPSFDHNALFREAPVHRRPKEIEKEILVAGEDFCGLMQASRISIGLMILWYPQARQKPFNENSFFWVHHTDAFLKLSIASDRLRDLLIVACTGNTAKSYKDMGRSYRYYVKPFQDASSLLANRGLNDHHLAEPLAVLPNFADQLFTYIDRRNKIVHEVATRMAKIVGKSVSDLQERYDHEQEHGFTPPSRDPSVWATGTDTHFKELQSKIDCSSLEITEWYRLLVQASNSIFQVEYWSRVLAERHVSD